MKVLPLFKSHYSYLKSILTLEEPIDKKGNSVSNSIFHLLKSNSIDKLVLVDENVSGVLQAAKISKEQKIKFHFGLRISVVEDLGVKNEDSLKSYAKYIIFFKGPESYKKLIEIWTVASIDGFYYEPRIDYKTLKKIWDDKLMSLAIPFYDSFLYLNCFESHIHVPDWGFTTPIMLIEDNNLPFDIPLGERVKKYSDSNNLPIINAQSIFYEKPEDFLAYETVRCLGNRSNLEKPELQHMNSNEFNFQKWKSLNN